MKKYDAPFDFVVVYNEFFFQDFDSEKTVGLLFFCKHNFAEISLSKDSQKVEVV